MKLYKNAISPFARKVMIVLHETNQLDAVECVEVFGTTIDPGTIPIEQNPLGKLPVLERPDGPAVYDSRVICRYLDAMSGDRLYPQGTGQWDHLTLEATADGIMDSSVLMVYEGRIRPPEMQYDVVVDAHWQKISRAIAALNSVWISHLRGPLTMGQIAVGCALGYADFRLPDRDWRSGNVALADWYGGFSQRDSMIATAPRA